MKREIILTLPGREWLKVSCLLLWSRLKACLCLPDPPSPFPMTLVQAGDDSPDPVQ